MTGSPMVEMTFDPSPEVPPAEVRDERDQRFGRYRLRYQLGSGGMASIYLARVTGPAGFDKPVAIKRMHPHLARRQEFVDMFLDEARLTSRIDHPNVCTVFDFGEVEGSYYMAMEYLVGEPLTVILAALQEKNAFDSPRWRALAARVIADACEGLHAAHELKDRDGTPLVVVHRDVSPSNLFATFDGAVKVVDFGVAKAAGRLHQTTTGTVKGKFSYMSPEQVQGHEVDRRSDVFSLGICLWEMICGRRLFRRKTEMEMMNAVSSGPILAPRSVVPGTPPQLEAIVLRALDRDRVRRYPTARDMGRELRAYLQQQDEPTALPDLAEFMAQMLLREHTAKLDIIRTVMGDSQRSKKSDIAFAHTAVLSTPEARNVTGTISETRRVQRGEEPSPQAEMARPSAPTIARAAPGASPVERLSATTGLRPWVLVAGGAGLSLVLLLAIVLGAYFGLSGGDDEQEPKQPTLAIADVTPPAIEPTPVGPPTDVADELPPDDLTFGAEDVLPVEAEDVLPVEVPEAETEPNTDERDSPRGRTTSNRPGTVNIATRGGWAHVYVRGRRLPGTTPKVIQLPPGRHVIELRPLGREPGIRVPITVTPGGNHRIRRSVQ